MNFKKLLENATDELGFTMNEYHFMCDIFNGVMINQSELNLQRDILNSLNAEYNQETARKWEVNLDDLNSKIQNMVYDELVKLIYLIEIFWDDSFKRELIIGNPLAERELINRLNISI